MKKKILLLIACIVFMAVCANAQVRIGGTVAPNQSAVLDLNPTDSDVINKAFVLPRVNLQATTTRTLSETLIGMTVYNMATANDVTPGVYYWDGTKWVRFVNKMSDLITYIALGDSIAIHFNNTTLKDSIINLIHDNEIDGVIGNEVVGASDLTLIRTGAGTADDPYKLKVNINVVADSLLANNTFITNMADSIAQYIQNTSLGDTILNYLTNNITQELTDSIMRYVTIDGTRGITVNGSGTSHITINLPNGTQNNVLAFNGSEWVSTDLSSLTVAEVDGVIGNEVVDASDATLVRSGAGTGADPYKLRANTSVIGDSLVSNSTFINNLGDELVSNSTFVNNMGDELVSNNTFITNLGDELVSNNTFITNMGDSLAHYINNTNLGDTIINMIQANETVTTLTNNNNGTYTYTSENGTETVVDVVGDIYTYGDTLLSNTQFITDISDSIAKYISVTNLGDTILNYMTNNVSQAFTDSIMQHVVVDGTRGITVNGSGTSHITINLPNGTQSNVLAFNGTEWVSTDLSSLTVAEVDGVIGNEVVDASDNTLTRSGLGTASSPYKLKANINSIGDSLVNSSTFVTNMGDELVSNNTFVTNMGDELVSNNTFVTNLGDSLANSIHNTTLGDTIINLVNQNASKIKRIEISLDGTAKYVVESRVLVGTTSTSTKDIRIISIQPEIITSGAFDEALDLNVSTTAKVTGNAIRWTVRCANENYVAGNKYGVSKIYVYYICEDDLTHQILNDRIYTQPILSVKTVMAP
jgi:hypothetical protein